MAGLKDRDEIAAPLRKKIEALNKRQAAEFRRLLGSPPDPGNVPQSFWNGVQKENEEALLALLLLLFLTSYDAHRTWGKMEKPKDDAPRDKIAEQWTKARAADVAAGINKRSIEMLDNAGRGWSAKTKQGVDVPKDEIDQIVDSIFGEGRVDTIVRTEGQQAVVEGGDAGVTHGSKESGIKVTRYWGHVGRRPPNHSNALINPCPVCSPREGLPQSRWRGLWPGQCHPGCDCFVVYVDQEGFVLGTDTPGLTPGNSPGMVWKFRSQEVVV